MKSFGMTLFILLITIGVAVAQTTTTGVPSVSTNQIGTTPSVNATPSPVTGVGTPLTGATTPVTGMGTPLTGTATTTTTAPTNSVLSTTPVPSVNATPSPVTGMGTPLTGISTTATPTNNTQTVANPNANPFNTGIALNPNFTSNGVSQILVNPTSGTVFVGTTTTDANGIQSVHFPAMTLGTSLSAVPTATLVGVSPTTGAITVRGITQRPDGTFTNVQK